eukprot:NODE_11857_length_1261_cov_3.727513.p2 GENE.NODE_11857_length_1261_cov_3.727513~~NODE_11857_length_1261_cov_3.727513.p2  ORF type:complete len:129 (+),score=29.23 NODE_11857_length_1261_cov_3.727513:652-1038(+)
MPRRVAISGEEFRGLPKVSELTGEIAEESVARTSVSPPGPLPLPPLPPVLPPSPLAAALVAAPAPLLSQDGRLPVVLAPARSLALASLLLRTSKLATFSFTGDAGAFDVAEQLRRRSVITTVFVLSEV